MKKPAVEIYYEALERLVNNRPIKISKDSAINKDTVALEAGRKRGSIRNRSGFEQLLKDIEIASNTNKNKRSIKSPEQKLDSCRGEIKILKERLEETEQRYMSLLNLNFELAKKIKELGGDVPTLTEIINFKDIRKK